MPPWTDPALLGLVRQRQRGPASATARPGTQGRIWHAPTNPPRAQREAVADLCDTMGRAPVPVRGYPRLTLTVGGRFNAVLRELRETLCQFERPYVLDSSAISRELGLDPTPWDEVCRATALGVEPVPTV